MKIQIRDVRERSRDFRLEGTLALEGFDNRVGRGRILARVHVNPVGERWYLSARVEGRFPFTCDRCGRPYEDELEGEFSLVVLGRAVRGLDESESEDVVLLPADNPELDLSEQVRECMLLELPIRFLCRENCPGLELEPENEADEADERKEADPRWGPLLDLKAKLESEEKAGSEERQE